MFIPIGSNLPLFRFPVVTMGWIFVSTVFFFYVARTGHSEISYQMSVIPAETNPIWKYFSYQFTHASFGHLLSNMWYFGIFGWILENAIGGPLFLGMTLLFGAVAVLPEVVFQSDLSVPIIGASGAVAFTMGTATALFPKSRVKLLFMLIPLPNFPNSIFVPIRYLVYFWLMMQVSGLAMNAWLPPKPVAYATHLAGFGLGLLVGLVMHFWKKDQYVDVELSGGDLKDFYAGLKAFQAEQFETANRTFDHISNRHPWTLRLQMQLFHTALIYRQKNLAEQIWRRTIPSLLMLRRTHDAEKALRSFWAAFHEMPPLLVQERVKLKHLLKSHLKDDEEINMQLLSMQKVLR